MVYQIKIESLEISRQIYHLNNLEVYCLRAWFHVARNNVGKKGLLLKRIFSNDSLTLHVD